MYIYIYIYIYIFIHTYTYTYIYSYSPLLVRGRLIIRYFVSISEFIFFGMGQFPNLQGEGTKNFRALVNLLGYLVRIGLVEVRACFWGQRTNILKAVGMVSINPKDINIPAG